MQRKMNAQNNDQPRFQYVQSYGWVKQHDYGAHLLLLFGKRPFVAQVFIS